MPIDFQADPERWLFCRADFDYVKRVGTEYMKQPIYWKGHNEMAVVIGKSGKNPRHVRCLAT